MKPSRSDSSSRSEKIACVILAGGLSRRLGSPKQLLPWGTGTLLEHAVGQAEAVESLDPIVCVLPPGELVPEPRCARAVAVRREASDGCSASLRSGLAALPAEAVAVAILPADQPGLTAKLIAEAASAWLRERPEALALRYRGAPGHPLIFCASLLPMLSGLRGDKALWDLLQEMSNAVRWVEIDEPAPPDVNTLEDYRRLHAAANT